MNDMKVNIKWSKSVKVITIVASVLSLVALIALLWSLTTNFHWIGLIVVILILTIIPYFMLSAPLSIAVDKKYLIINKFIGKLKISRVDIDAVDIYISNGLEARLFGSGGFFGYVGQFYSKQFGKYTAYVGDYKQTFSLTMKNGKKYLLSCENRDVVVSILKEKKQ